MLRARAGRGPGRGRAHRVGGAPWTGARGPVMAILGRVTNRAASVLRATALAGTILLASGCAACSRRSRPTTTSRRRRRGAPAASSASTCATSPSSCPPRARPASSSARPSTAAPRPSTSPSPSRARRPRPPSPCPASSGRTLSDAATGVEIPGIPVAPGTMVQMTVTTRRGRRQRRHGARAREHGHLRRPHGLVLLSPRRVETTPSAPLRRRRVATLVRCRGRAQTSNL